MPITEKDFPSLCDDIDEIFNEVASDKVTAMQGPKIFKVGDTNRKTYDHLILHGLGGVKEVVPGHDLPEVTGEEGDTISWTQRYFGAMAVVTKDMRKFDLHDQIEGIVRSLPDDAFDKIEQSMADVLLYGWATAYYDVYGKSVSAVGGDAVCLFSASHSNNLNSSVFSNVITSNPPLSRPAILTGRKQARTFKDPNGIKRGLDLDTMIVAPSNEDLGERLLYSNQIPGSGNNDINALKGKVKNFIVWDQLETRSDDTDTSAYWFLSNLAKVKESLQCKFAERPSLDAPEQVYANKNWDWSLDFYYALGLGYARYIYGSNAGGS